MKIKYTHISFTQFKPKKPRKTEIWAVRNKAGEYLGQIRWYPGWRQYCWFTPNDTSQGVIMAKSCLDDVSHFIQQLMDKRKEQSNAYLSEL